MISLKQLQKIIDPNFSEPFLKEGIVTTKLYQKDKKERLRITIGRRDISIDENGDIVSAGILLIHGADFSGWTVV
jgi:hypothetical protein